MPRTGPRAAALATLLVVSVLTSGLVGSVAAGTSTAPTPEQTTNETPTGEAVIDRFIDRVETLETVAFTRTVDTDSGNFSSNQVSRIAADLTDSQRRTEALATNQSAGEGTKLVTVIDGDTVRRYNPSENRVTESDNIRSSLLPLLEGYTDTENVDYDYRGTATVAGTETYVLEAEMTADARGNGNGSATVYVDTETYFPIRSVSKGEVGGEQFTFRVTHTNVTINEHIPDSRFELDVPEDATRPSEDDDTGFETTLPLPDRALPEEFTFERALSVTGEGFQSTHVRYTDGAADLTVGVTVNSQVSFDYSEHEAYEAVDLGSTTGYVSTADDYVMVVWNDGPAYSVSGYVDRATAIEVAQAVNSDN